MLRASPEPLSASYDLVMLDLDGVVYVGPRAVPGAPEHLARAREAGMRLAFVTNNASRPPDRVAAHLRELGIEASDEDVVTSAQAAARLLAEQLPAGAKVFLIGGTGLDVALREQGLEPVQDPADDPVAVVSGFSAELRWGTVMAGAILVRRGLPWVASNTDATVPTPDGQGPGNGMLVGVVSRFAEREPVVAGKPEAALFEETVLRVGGTRPIMVGDRLDTDIEGATRAGYDSLLVMTGVTDAAALVAAAPPLRPTYVAADLRGLTESHPHVEVEGSRVGCGGWQAEVQDGRLLITGRGTLDDWWRSVAVAGWRHLDTTGTSADVSDLQAPGILDGDAAEPEAPPEHRESP